MPTLEDRLTAFARRVAKQFNDSRPRLLPAGGGGGQVLTKASATDFDIAWATPAAVGSGSVSPFAGDKLRTLAVTLSSVKGAPITFQQAVADSFAGQSGMAVQELASSFPTMSGMTSPPPYEVTDSNNNTGSEAGWKAFDGITNSGGGGTSFVGSSSRPAWLRKKNATTDTLWGYVVTPRNDGYGRPAAWQFQGSNDDNVWTVLDTQTGQSIANGARMTYTIPVANRAPYKYYRFYVTATSSTGDSIALAELEFLKQFAPNDSTNYFFAGSAFTNVSAGNNYSMDLRSVPATADAPPTKAGIFVALNVVNGLLKLNTNVSAQASRDGGKTWTTLPLSDAGTANGFQVFDAPATDLSLQPSGTAMRFRIQTDTSIGVVLDSVVFEWA